MAHFAELNDFNVVRRVLVVHNDITTIDGVENEQLGIDFLNNLYPDSGRWVQTSYNGNFRGLFAGLEFIYEEDKDRFIPYQPAPSWVWDEEFYGWKAPVQPQPAGHVWSEDDLAWIKPSKPFTSWVWDETGRWSPPVPYPGGSPEYGGDGKAYDWDEENQQWVLIDE